jgi:NAD(P)-dependent dehydrogenase (short-subunit alcohol dehydrogenase family)
VYSLNVKVPYFLVAELAPLMAKRGKGAIVNLSTMVADYGAAGMALYDDSSSGSTGMAGRAKAQVTEVPGSHAIYVSKPAGVAEFSQKAANSVVENESPKQLKRRGAASPAKIWNTSPVIGDKIFQRQARAGAATRKRGVSRPAASEPEQGGLPW